VISNDTRSSLATMSSVDVIEHCGDITYRELDYWIRTGAIEPEYGSEGSGRPRRFTMEQAEWLRRIVVVRSALAEHGIVLTTEAIREMWNALVNGDPWLLAMEL